MVAKERPNRAAKWSGRRIIPRTVRVTVKSDWADVWRTFADQVAPLSVLLISTRFASLICSYEHESIFTAYLGANIAQVHGQTSTDGAEPMDPTLATLKAALEVIRDRAVNALNQIERPQVHFLLVPKPTA
jgi:hypothetical protein